ncbi:MAG: hypothetical protein A2Y10_03170 [Planctomycetes bacterium GWF2_41_51]|nr:MAG: hypothetical protein A2Y10_03170 [Planctomycetes bacterium GWF2_41_51]
MNYQLKNKHEICAVMLAANNDFGCCRLASRIPPALWPVPDEPAINKLLQKLTNLSVKKAIICSNSNTKIFQMAVENPASIELFFLDEQMPLGTAGCIREAVKICQDEILIVIPSQMADLPDLTDAIIRHIDNQSTLTILSGSDTSKSTAHIYIANRDIIKWIPAKGYFDIKENLIAALVKQNKKVVSETLTDNLYSYRNHTQYLEAMSKYLIEKECYSNDTFVSKSAIIDESVRIFAPVIILNNSIISENAVIIGPAVIGNDVIIDKNSLIVQSVLWDGSHVNKNCFVSNSVIDYNAAIPSFCNVESKAVIRSTGDLIKQNITSVLQSALVKIKYTPPLTGCQGLLKPKTASLIIIAAIFIWSYFPEIRELLVFWNRSNDYSAGLLVPFLAGIAIWMRKQNISQITMQSFAFGISIYIVAQMIRLFGLYFMFSSAERFSLILSIWSVIIILFGWRLFYNNLAPFLFLILMLPPPHIIHNSIMLPLQKIATSCAVFCIGLLGYVVNRQGNILYIDNTAIAVSEACSGLRMITAFIIIIVFTSLIIKKSKWEKISLLLSSLPIAFACNIIRLTITAIAFTVVWGQRWAALIHDFSGYAMVPLGLAMLLFEIKLMNILVSKT